MGHLGLRWLGAVDGLSSEVDAALSRAASIYREAQENTTEALSTSYIVIRPPAVSPNTSYNV